MAGDLQGLNTLEHQPAKIAAMEGHFETQRGAPLILFGLPDSEKEEVRYSLEIPKLGSVILTHSLDGEIRGLKEWAPEERPPVGVVFLSFRIMIGIGLLMALIGLFSLYLRWHHGLYDNRRFHRIVLLMGRADSPPSLLAGSPPRLDANRTRFTVCYAPQTRFRQSTCPVLPAP